MLLNGKFAGICALINIGNRIESSSKLFLCCNLAQQLSIELGTSYIKLIWCILLAHLMNGSWVHSLQQVLVHIFTTPDRLSERAKLRIHGNLARFVYGRQQILCRRDKWNSICIDDGRRPGVQNFRDLRENVYLNRNTATSYDANHLNVGRCMYKDTLINRTKKLGSHCTWSSLYAELR